ncbi:MAG: MBL fold metallo-hydrolase [Sulfuricaulis sp.]|nr:MBL fold metallo-hydrolase [Sulfuricaulis sp.]
MTDTPFQRERLEKPKLIYPFEKPPEVGNVLKVAPGVVWMRMPLPMALNHINVWCLEDNTGWTVVDTGMRTDETLAAWRALFAKTTEQRPLTRVFVTHMHPDHIGMAGWLTRKFNCRLWMTRLEYLNCRVLTADTGREAPEDGVKFYRKAGWSDGAVENYQARFGNFGKRIHALPESYHRIKDGEEVRIGANIWRVIVGTGHSPEHACLYCKELKLLISGDQVLPRISSNVSVQPTEPDADPMHDWLESLAKIKREVPDDVLVLPSHNDCFRGLHARLDYLAASQERTLDRLRKTLKEPRRAIDVFAALFGRSIDETDGSLLNLATGESLACLNYLLHRGEIGRELNDAGVAMYQMV